jgi:uncharacterized membrane protein YhaH (DUF805 family)
MKFREAVSSVFHKYADFKGRARRSEYWYFVLFNLLIYVLLYTVSMLILLAGAGRGSSRGMQSALGGAGILYFLYGIYALASIIPGLAVCCRRLHDTGHSGACILFVFIPFVGAIILLVWVLAEGNAGPNQYGPDPKSGEAHDVPERQQREPAQPQQPPEQHYSPRPYIITESIAAEGVRKAPQAAPAGATIYLEGIAGCFAGHRIPVRGVMVAGRHPSCGICFPKDTHGVSHQHCQFRVNGSSLVVTDVGSSFGTFVNDKRLIPNQPVTLSRGDTILLGSRKQGFRVAS